MINIDGIGLVVYSKFMCGQQIYVNIKSNNKYLNHMVLFSLAPPSAISVNNVSQ